VLDSFSSQAGASFRGGLSGATLGAKHEPLAAESPAKRRAGPQAVDSTRSSLPTRRGKPSKPAAKGGRLRTVDFNLGGHSRHSGWFWCWIRSWRSPARLLVAGLWRADSASDPSRGQAPPTESPPIRRAEPRAVDSTKSSTPTRRGKASKPAAKGADSAPCSPFSEALLAVWKSHGAGFVLLTGRRVF
jgi:hypothetical protein